MGISDIDGRDHPNARVHIKLYERSNIFLYSELLSSWLNICGYLLKTLRKDKKF